MKLNLFISLILSLLTYLSYAQTWNIDWQHTSQKTTLDYFADLAETPDGKFIVLGCEGNSPKNDLYLMCYDKNGNTLWTQSFTTRGNDVPHRVQCMPNGDCLILAQTGPETAPQTLLLKTDLNGIEKWRSTLDSGKQYLGNDVISLPDNGYLLCGSSNKTQQQKQLWLARYNEKGEMLWEKNYAEKLQGSILSAKRLPNNDFIFSARVQGSSKNDCDIMVIRTDSLGNKIWLKQLPSPQAQEWPECICCSPDSCFILVGWVGNCLNDINSEYPVFDHDLLVKKLDRNGTVLWSRSIDGEGSEGGNAVIVRPNGHFIAAGGKLTSFSGKVGPWLLHLDGNGDTLDELLLNIRLNQAARIINTSDGGFVVIGPGLHDKLNVRSDGWIIKFSDL